MRKPKDYCWMCEERHFPPTGKKCQMASKGKKEQEASTSQVGSRSRDSLLSKTVSASKTTPRHGCPSVAMEKDSHVKKVSTPGQDDLSNSDEGGTRSKHSGSSCKSSTTLVTVVNHLMMKLFYQICQV